MSHQQLFQDLRDGRTFLEKVPFPSCGSRDVLIETRATLISLGTEKMLLSFGKASYLEKARQQPEKVKMVLDKVKTDGLMTTIDAVQSKLSDPLPLGYCNAGIVIAVGSAVEDIRPGDRVVSNGPHADVVVVNRNLVAKIPDTVAFDNAAFTVLGSIALNGVRVFAATLGETVAVVGLGLLGQMTLDFLKSAGVRAVGFDLDQSKIDLAKNRGFEAHSVTVGTASFLNLFDGAIITASSKGNEPLEFSAEVTRKRGRVVGVGAFEISVARKPFYDKELEFRMATSYGPGRYDPVYESKGVDYPIAYVRWTENRNFETILQLLGDGRIDFSYLISGRYPFETAEKAYESILSDSSTLGIVLEYKGIAGKADGRERTVRLREDSKSASATAPRIAVIGAGNFSKGIIFPALKKLNANLVSVASSKGGVATLAAKRFDASSTTTDVKDLLARSDVNTVIISTPHGSHADLAISALEAGKNVFVEKPLAVSMEQLKRVVQAHRARSNATGTTPNLMVGFNRRFSPFAVSAFQSFKGQPISMNYTVNAGFIPPEVWVHSPEDGGGRIIGEGCHFIDLMSYIADSKVTSVHSMSVLPDTTSDIRSDNVSIQLEYANGSLGSLQYSSQGAKSYPKEKLVIFGSGKAAELDNFRKLKGHGVPSLSKWSQDKGHFEEFKSFLSGIESGKAPLISFESLLNTTLATFAHVRSLKEKRRVFIHELENELFGQTH